MILQNKSNGRYATVRELKIPYGWWYMTDDTHVEILGPGILKRRAGSRNSISYWVIPESGIFGPMPEYWRERVYRPENKKCELVPHAIHAGDNFL